MGASLIGRTRSRVETVQLISEFFYVSAGICFLLCLTCVRDEESVTEFVSSLAASLQAEPGDRMEFQKEGLLFETIEVHEEISPDPQEAPAVELKRTISLPTLREAGKEVNKVIKKVMNSLTFTEAEEFEKAPLLDKV